jgi:hypothetical protein
MTVQYSTVLTDPAVLYIPFLRLKVPGSAASRRSGCVLQPCMLCLPALLLASRPLRQVCQRGSLTDQCSESLLSMEEPSVALFGQAG